MIQTQKHGRTVSDFFFDLVDAAESGFHTTITKISIIELQVKVSKEITDNRNVQML